jgi:hypothetical protein
VAQVASLLMKVGALGFARELNRTFSINLQLLGGIWILQTFPAIVISLYTRWFHRSALIFGWAVGMAYGTIQAYRMPGGGQAHFGTSAAPVFGHVTYIGITALILNLAVAALLTLVFRQIGVQDGWDATKPGDYTADPVTVPTTAAVPRTQRHAVGRTAGTVSEPARASEPASTSVPAPGPGPVPAPGPGPVPASGPGPVPAAEPESVATPWAAPSSWPWADAATTQPLPTQPPAPPGNPLPPEPRPPRRFAFMTRERAASRRTGR